MMVDIAYAQQIIIDPNGNVGFAPTMQRSSNPPVVNIARPNSGGVSHNQYENFSVPTQGAVLNNSTSATNTRVAGNIAANPNLSGTTASTIVNEVTSSNASNLLGAIEVAGDRADVIVANPNGVSCNGCYFINADDGTLTTGVPTVNGATVSLEVLNGTVTIGRKGLRGEAGFRGAVDNINLIGRTVIVDGKVTAVDGINIQGGAGTYDANTGRLTSLATGQGDKPSYAVDATAYGAMEAGRITIVGNESGLGVRTLGALQSNVGNIEVKNRSNLQVRSASAQGRAIINSTHGSLTLERDITSATSDVYVHARHHLTAGDQVGLYGANGVSLYARNQKLTYSGVIQSNEDVTVYARKDLTFGAYGYAVGTFDIAGLERIILEDATIVADAFTLSQGGTGVEMRQTAIFVNQDIAVQTGNFHMGEDVVIEGLSGTNTPAMSVTGTGDLTVSGDIRLHSNVTLSFAGNLINEQGGVLDQATIDLFDNKTVTNRGLIYDETFLNINGPTSFTNEETGQVLSDRIYIWTWEDVLNKGQIATDGDLHVTSKTKVTNNGFMRGGRIYLTAPQIEQGGGGQMRAATYLSATAMSSFNNAGIFNSTESMRVIGGTFTNTGTITANTNADLRGSTWVNDGFITAGYSLVARATGNTTNRGSLISYNGLTIQGANVVDNYGTIVSDNGLSITGNWFRNLGADSFLRSKGSGIYSNRIRNDGEIYFFNEFRRQDNIDYFENRGVFASADRIRIRGRDASSSIVLRANSVMIAGLQPDDESQTLRLGESIDLDAQNALTIDGRIAAGGSIYLRGHDGLSVNGTLNARQHILLYGDVIGLTPNAVMQADGAGFVTTLGTFTNDGQISLGSYLRLGGGATAFTNNNYIGTTALDRFAVDGTFANNGVLVASAGLSLGARSIVNAGHLQTSGNVSLRGQFIEADGTITKGTVTSRGSISAERAMSLVGGTISLASGSYTTATQLAVTADRFHNSGQAVLSGTSRNDWSVAQDFRQNGETFSDGPVRVFAQSLSTGAGSQLASNSYISVYLTDDASVSGALTAFHLLIDGKNITTGTASSLYASSNLRLYGSGRVLTQGETVAANYLNIRSDYFDIRGNTFAKQVDLDAAKSSKSSNNVYASGTVTVDLASGTFSNYGLFEAQDKITINAQHVSNSTGGEIASTELDFNVTGNVVTSGKLFGARTVDLSAGGRVQVNDGGEIEAVSLGFTTRDFVNLGRIDVYGFYGEVSRNAFNEKTIDAESYFGLEAATFQNRTGASLRSGEYLFLRSAGTISNYATASIRGKDIDFRGGALSNSGTIHADNVVNVVETTGNISNAVSGRIYGKTIALYAGGSFDNKGIVGQRGNAAAKAESIYITAGSTFRNSGTIRSLAIRAVSESSGGNSGEMRADTGLLAITSNTSYVYNSGQLRGRDIVVDAGGTVDNHSLIRASETVQLIAGDDIRNRVNNGSTPDIGGKIISLVAEDRIDTHGKLFGYQRLGLLAKNGAINNTGQITGPDITIVAERAGVWSTAGIYAGGTLAIQAQNMGLRGRIAVDNQVTLHATHYNIEANSSIETKRLLISAIGEVRGNAGSFRGSELTQIIAGNLVRLDGNATGKLATISGAQKDIYVELTDGTIGVMGSDVYNAKSNHQYDRANFDVTGGVSIKASGHILLAGLIRADDDIYIKAGNHMLLGATGYSSGYFGVFARAQNPATLDAGDILHLEAGGLLKNYVGTGGALNLLQPAALKAGNRMHLLAGQGWFYSDQWLRTRTINTHLSIQANTIIFNSDHYLGSKHLFASAHNDIRQNNVVISARKITYSAGRDILVRFNPFVWRENNAGLANSGDWWDVPRAGYRGNSLLTQAQGLSIYAGRDLTLRSGKVRSGGSITLTAGRNFLSEPVYLESGRTNRPAYVGWNFSSKYKGVQSGHTASAVTIRELRAYENQIQAAQDITITAGAHANFIGSYLSAGNDITIEALNGGVNMVSAPGFWNYNYTKRTVKKKLFGLYRSTTTYEFDAAEDIYKRTILNAARDITIRATGTNGVDASIILAGPSITAGRNTYVGTPNGNLTGGFYTERSVTESSSSTSRKFLFIPFGSSSSEEKNLVLVNYGTDFRADEILTLDAPKGTVSISGGSISARTLNVNAARVEINALINSTRQSLYTRKDNMITITTIQSGSESETAEVPQINVPNINWNVTDNNIHIQGVRGSNLNNQLVQLIGSRTFDQQTLGLADSGDRTNAENQQQSIVQIYDRDFVLPGAEQGAQFSYLDTLVSEYGAEYHTITLRDRTWYDKQVQLNPAFKALLQAVVSYIVGGLPIDLGTAAINAGVEAATSSLIVGVVEGTITGEFDMDDVLRGALLSGVSSSISTAISSNIDWGAGLSDQSPFVNDVRGTFSPAQIVDRLGDRVTNQIVTNVVYGNDVFDGFDNLGRTFLVSETMALAQFGIGELGDGNDNAWEGSVGHILLHGGVGCLALEVLNGDCVAGFFSGASSAILAGSNLTNDQKLELAPLVGAFAGYIASAGNPMNVSFGSTIALSGIRNNYLSHTDIAALADEIAECQADAVDGQCEGDEFLRIVEKYKELSRINDYLLVQECGMDSACINDRLATIPYDRTGSASWTEILEMDPRFARELVGSIDVADYVYQHINRTNTFEAEKAAVCGDLTGAACDAYWEEHVAGTAVVLGVIVDFIPVLGDLKGAAECLELGTLAACGGAVVGIVPLGGDLIKVVIRRGDEVTETTIRQSDSEIIEINTGSPTGSPMEGVDFGNEFDILRGELDLPEDLATLSTRQVGDIGEAVAEDFMRRQGFEPVIAVRNASGNGFDYVVRGEDGVIRFVEVKSTRTGNIGDLSALQADSQTYVMDILEEVQGGTLRGQPVSSEMMDFADDYLSTVNDLSPPIPTTAIGIDLLNEEVFVSAW